MRVSIYDIDGNYIRSYTDGMFSKHSRTECLSYLDRLISSFSGKDIRAILDINHISYRDPQGDLKYCESNDYISFYLNCDGSLAYISLEYFVHQNIAKLNSWEDLYKAICSFIYYASGNSDVEVRSFVRNVKDNLVSFYRSLDYSLENQINSMPYGDLSHLEFDCYSSNEGTRSLKGYMVVSMKEYFRELFWTYGYQKEEGASIRKIPEKFWIETLAPNIKFSDNGCNFCYINGEIYYL